MPFRTKPRTESPYERAVRENTNAENAMLKAAFDYNVMMGNIEDPEEEDEDDE